MGPRVAQGAVEKNLPPLPGKISAFNYHHAMKKYEVAEVKLHHSYLGSRWRWGVQLHAPTALSPEKEAPVLTG
jgi:hypothetical protein